MEARRPRARNRTGEGIHAGDVHGQTQDGFFVDKHQTLAATSERGTVVVNALGPQFHKGLEPSRYGRPGRVPGSCNVSAATLLDPQTKAFIPLGEAEAKFKAQGITKDKRVVAYCGGGISATVDLFLLHRLGYDKLTLYDGSMGEWAKDTRCRSRRVDALAVIARRSDEQSIFPGVLLASPQ